MRKNVYLQQPAVTILHDRQNQLENCAEGRLHGTSGKNANDDGNEDRDRESERKKPRAPLFLAKHHSVLVDVDVHFTMHILSLQAAAKPMAAAAVAVGSGGSK